MKISTVNVLEINDGIPQQIVSFKEGKKGNSEAEVLFEKMATENGALKPDMESYLEDGIYSSGTYSVCLTHSS